ncbi:MAG: carbamoyl phosphate synthase large subunit, partial [Proteobacteria bacterium]|nr:carbamoyl phosphate synthase large subunit [Candidatus Avisuccinivibrio stercorigallinarum]
ELDVRGLMNVQLAVREDKIYLIEVNPRAARTVPFVSKATSLPLAKIAARIMAGQSLEDQGITEEIVPPYYSVKEVVLPFMKFPGSDPILGPEMRSTGEVMGTAKLFPEAYAKAQLAAGSKLVRSGRVLLSIRNSDKAALPRLGDLLIKAGFEIDATGGTYKCLAEAGIPARHVKKVYEGRPNILDGIKSGNYSWVINTTEGRQSVMDSRSMRRGALQYRVAYCTTMNAALAAMEAITEDEFSTVHSLQELHQKIKAQQS